MDAFVDAEALARELSLEELNEAAEAYFAAVTDPSYLFAKPLGGILEAPTMLMHFAAMVYGLWLEPKDTVLDFGAGAGWTSRMLAQLDCHVIACDVSPRALELAQELFRVHPTLGFGEATFLRFDGRVIELPDASVDRIAVMDAFHHVPNWPQVLSEFHRVLKPGGRVVMAEPGPAHSQTAAAQSEMRTYTVLERDVRIEDIEILARQAGFASMAIGMYSGHPVFVPVDQFEEELATGQAAAAGMRDFLVNHRLIALSKNWDGVHTSRDGTGLAGRIDLSWAGGLHYRGTVTNIGEATWLPQEAEHGSVRLGVQILDEDGSLRTRDHQRVPLRYNPTCPVRPGQSVTVEFDVVDPGLDRYRLGFDLVSEHVAWFADVSPGVTLTTNVLPLDGALLG